MNMEVKREVLEKLICNACGQYLSIGPVMLLNDGKSVCGRCSIPDEQLATRMLPYEHLAEEMLFPCQYRKHGCPKLRTFTELKSHEADCKFKPYTCILHVDNCDWVGPKKQLLQHFKDMHPTHVLENPATFQYDITRNAVRRYLIGAFNMLFLIHTKVCLETQKIYHCVRLLADSEWIQNYSFTLEIFNTKTSVIQKGDVAPQERVTCGEEDSLAISINNLIGILGSYKDINYKLTLLEIKPPKRDTSLVDELVCCKCNKVITFEYAYYYDDQQWHCFDCTDNNRNCPFKSKGCNYLDTCYKSGIHSWYYCSYRADCILCGTASTGTLNDHYRLQHCDITYVVGQFWTENISSDKHFILSSNIGRLHCNHRLYNSHFYFSVSSMLRSGELHFYTCELQLRNPNSQEIFQKTLPLNRSFNYCDWRVCIPENVVMKYVNDNTFNMKIIIGTAKGVFF